MSIEKKQTQLQRIKILETVVGKLYVQQRELIKYITEKTKEDESEPTAEL